MKIGIYKGIYLFVIFVSCLPLRVSHNCSSVRQVRLRGLSFLTEAISTSRSPQKATQVYSVELIPRKVFFGEGSGHQALCGKADGAWYVQPGKERTKR